MTTKKKGKAYNPKGVNQYAEGKGLGLKDSALYIKISSKDKEKLKEAASKRGMNLTSWLLSIVLEAAEG
jgi:predicted DNA binding CopG/RHH family protein